MRPSHLKTDIRGTRWKLLENVSSRQIRRGAGLSELDRWVKSFDIPLMYHLLSVTLSNLCRTCICSGTTKWSQPDGVYISRLRLPLVLDDTLTPHGVKRYQTLDVEWVYLTSLANLCWKRLLSHRRSIAT
jgi:hypothetical protein